MSESLNVRSHFYIGFPKSFQEIKYYGLELLEGKAVVINLSLLEPNDQEKCRIFISGVILAIRGSMEDISSDILLAIPPDMDLVTENFIRGELSYSKI